VKLWLAWIIQLGEGTKELCGMDRNRIYSVTRFASATLALMAFWAPITASQTAVSQDASSAPVSEPLTIPSGHKFIMQLETALHTRTTHKDERAEFTTAADVVVDNQVLIPNKSLVQGTVIKVKRAGLLFGRAEIQIRLDEIKLADGKTVPLKATITRVGFDPVDQEAGKDPKLKGESGGEGDAKSVASASAQGAIIGVLSGGTKGAMYGAAAGAAIAVVGMALRRGPDLDLPRSTMFEARFDQPAEIPISSMQARNAPLDSPLAPIEASVNPPEEERAANPPVLTDIRGEQPSEEIAVSRLPKDPPAATQAEPPVRTGSEAKAANAALTTISVKVRMVQVDAVVRDRAGRMIDNLKVDDFRIYEDGVLQDIQGFSRDELPLAVALVVDRSGSVAPYISELRKIAVQALNQLKQQDEVCLFSFADTVVRLEDLTADRRRIANALDGIRAEGGTDITDALHDSIQYLARTAPGRRHAVILISDNQQTTNPKAGEGETVKLAMETETVVYSLRTSGTPIPISSQLPSIILGRSPVNKIAQETGGEIIAVKQTSSLDSALASVINRLRMRYSLSYYPTSAAQGGAFHAIAVRLTDSHGKAGSDYFVHAKRGYYATTNSASSASTYPKRTDSF